MVIGTVRLVADAFDLRLAFLGAVVDRMIFKFFPAMALSTSILQVTSVLVSLRVFAGLPLVALSHVVLKEVWCSPEILPVMRVQAQVSLVLFVAERTPDSLEVEEIKIDILFHFLEHRHREFGLSMGESAE